jgi:hypothetical protein
LAEEPHAQGRVGLAEILLYQVRGDRSRRTQAEGGGMICDFCGGEGHEDAPCPVRQESAARYAAEGAKAYPPATGIEAMVCEQLRRRTAPDADKELTDIICREIAMRQRIGVAKYGATLADNPSPLKARMRHALEEALDLAVYARWAAQVAVESPVPDWGLAEMEHEAVGMASRLLYWMQILEYHEERRAAGWKEGE